MSTQDLIAARLADRYGTASGPHRGLLAAGITVALVLLGLLVWVAQYWSTPEVRGERVTFDVSPTSVSMLISVRKPADGTAVCRLRAIDEDFRTVGTAQIRLAPPEQGASTTLRVEIPTRSLAVNAELLECTAA